MIYPKFGDAKSGTGMVAYNRYDLYDLSANGLNSSLEQPAKC